jgi:hypothetical protein
MGQPKLTHYLIQAFDMMAPRAGLEPATT